MWKSICKNQLSHQLTILVNWSEINNRNTQQHTQTLDVK